MDRRPGNPIAWILGLLLTAGIVAIVLPGYLSSRRASNERAASAALKMIASAEADFRTNDREGNGIQDFWTADVAGLADLALLPVEIGKADPSRPGAQPYRGYWFVAMDLDEEGKPYRQDTGGKGTDGRKLYNHYKFGYCAYPVDPSTGRNMFSVNDGNTILKEPFTGEPRRSWPTDAELRNWYSKGLD